MAVKARGQIGLTDITDLYDAYLSLQSFTFQGDTTKVKSTQTFSVVVSARQGNQTVPAAVDTASLSLPTGLSVSSDNDSTSPTLTFTATTALTAAILTAFGNVLDIPVLVNNEATFHKAITIAIALTGSTGTAARSVLVGNENQTIYCDKDGNVSGEQTITIPFAGYNGAARVACTMTDPTLPSGFTKVSNTAATTTADGAYVCKVADGTALAATGGFDLVLTNSAKFTKRFTWSRTDVGATGSQGDPGVSATSVVCGNDAVTIACDKDGKAKAASTIVIPFAGYIGTTRAACTAAYSTLPSGVTLASNGNKAATASADGSLTFNVAEGATFGNAATMTGEITLTFTCNGQTFTRKFTWSKALTGATGSKGDQGDAGDDAISIAIISSGGTVFKNNTGTKTLTAHVFVGGAEVTGSDLTALGTLKWYKGSATTALSTGTSITVAATDVTDSETYECRLED